jgi:hypothetical protein
MSQRADAASFVPFEPLPAAKTAASGFRMKVVPAAESGPPSSASRFHTHGPTASPNSPTITLQRDGDKVTAIRIECVCGQVIELACVYSLSEPVSP